MKAYRRALPQGTLALAAAGLLAAGSAQGADLDSAASNPPQAAAAELLADLCSELGSSPGVEGDLGQRVCNLESGSVPESEADSALQAAAWEEATAQGNLPVEASSRQIANLGARLRALRLGAGGTGALAYGDAETQWPLLLASTGDLAGLTESASRGRLGGFVTAAFGFGDRDATEAEDGFDFDTFALTAGLDYRFSERFIAGVALASSRSDAELDGDDGEVSADGYGLSLYGTYYAGDFFLDLTATAGLTDFGMERSIRYAVDTDSVDETASSDTDASHYALALGAGYEMRRGAASFGPYAGLEYLRVDIDGFREHGAAEFNLEIGDQEVTSLLAVLGAQASYAVNAGQATLVPQLRAEWRHEYDDDPRSLRARLVNDPSGDSAVIESDAPDGDYFFVATGLLAALPNGATTALEYQTVLGLAEVTHHVLQLRLRVPF